MMSRLVVIGRQDGGFGLISGCYGVVSHGLDPHAPLQQSPAL